jgi:hypothetical protein
MSRWYWGAVLCAVGFAISWFMPAYMTLEGGAVWPGEIGRGWNNRDANGNPTHNDQGDRIKPNRFRDAALVAFGLGAVGLAGYGFLYPKKRRIPVGSARETRP